MRPKKLGRYNLIRVLGKGAMGLVYEGRDPHLDRRVAIKTIQVENLSVEAAMEYEQRFRTEARSAARLQHPNIVSVYDAGRDGDIAFLVMEFIQGSDLKHHLDQGEVYTLGQTLAIMGDLLSALDYAHWQNIVHRDIKPANLLIEAGGRVKLADFGVARIQDSGEATRTQGSLVGTLKYMSPEQVQGRSIDARADLFAAGIVLYQLLTGQRPFDGANDFAIIQQIIGHSPAPPSSVNPQLPPAVDAVLARALAKSREQRFADAQEFATALRAATTEVSESTLVLPVATPGSAHATWSATRRSGEAQVGALPGGSTAVPTVTQELELVYWKDIKDSADSEDIQGFLARFPAGIYAGLARRRLKTIGALAGEGADSGSHSGPETVIMPRSVSGEERTVLMPGSAGAGMLAALPEPPGHAWMPPEEGAEGSAGKRPSLERTLPLPVAPAAASRDAKVSVSATRPQPSSRPWGWALAGIVGVVLMAGAGMGLKRLSRPGTPLAAPFAVPAAASSAGLETGPAEALPPLASAPPAPDPAASKPPEPVAARKSAPDQDRPARRAQAGVAAGAAMPRHFEHAVSAAAHPRQACESRMLIAFQICMAEQCAKPAFAHHPVCVERRAMEQRRRDAEISR
ncbi:serine/threonine-protein kinase [Polaromonas jejuensis]|nr:serine/threonine-protein kinase [Polaromonas jejuensis]